MSDLHQYVPTKVDFITTAAVATAGIPAPIWMGYLDEAAKIAGIIYSIVGVTWVLIQIWKSRK